MNSSDATAKPRPKSGQQAKARYSESEAAGELGVSVDELRVLVRRHIVRTDEEMNNLSMAFFQPADVVILKLLAREQPDPVA